MAIKKGDMVVILSGKDKSKKGKVLAFDSLKNRVKVENLMLFKKHQKATQKIQAGIVDKPAWIPISKVMLVCGSCSTPTRIAHSLNDGIKVRICKKCKSPFDN